LQKTKIIFLGTNGWYDTKTGNTICILIETPNEYIVLDAGNGIYKLDRYIKGDKPIYLFLSHFHLDHVIGLHILAKFNFRQGLNICLKKGMKKTFNMLMDRRFTLPLNRLPFEVRLIELSEQNRKTPFLERCLLLSHPVPTLGFRFSINDKIVSYVPDTGMCENAFRIAKGADVLISECAFKPGLKCEQWPHLNSEDAAKMARETGAKKLVLVHFDAAVYQTLQERQTAARQARRIFNNTIAVEDGMILKMGG
jgi:ribonuclease BN (tRNA processing enzyme)